MSTAFSRFLMLLTLGLSLAAPPALAGGRSKPPVAVQPLTIQEADDLAFMREEEKLARDVYLAFQEKWALPVFANIAASEQNHMDAVLVLLRRYGLPDPAAGNLAGEFTDPDLQAVYDDLLVEGSDDALSALRVGGLVEETDLRDLDAALAGTVHADVRQVYENLACGSRNHLRAFVRAIQGLGDDYAAQVLLPAEVDAILAGTREACGR